MKKNINKKKIKIAIIHCGFIYSGGGERIVLEEARGLKKRGYLVDVFAPTVDSERCYPELLKELNVKPILSTYLKKLPLRNAIRMIVSSFLAPVIALGYRKYDIFIGANQPGAWIAYCMAKVLKKPYLVYLNQPNRIVYPRPVDVEYGWYSTERDYDFLYRFFRILKPFMRVLDGVSITSANAVLTNGRYIGHVIENIYSVWSVDAPAGAFVQTQQKILDNPKSIFEGSITAGGKEIKKPYLLITNRHDPQKKFEYVIEAFAKVLKTNKNLTLAIPGPFTKHTLNLMKLAKELKVEDKIVFCGQIPEYELQILYKNAAVYCYPSPEEDFGLGPLEAGGWGVPTVAWNHGGPTVTVEDGATGFLAKPYETSDYAAKIIEILKDKKLRVQMGKNAWEHTRNNFSWKNHLDILEGKIKENLNA